MSTALPMPVQRTFALLVILAMALGAVVPLVAPAPTRAAPTELFFSEYIEGSSNNKALEIYNGTGALIDLATSGYSVQMFFNGSTSAGLTINLTGTVASGDVYVVAQSSAVAAILAQADQTNSSGWFNGDDAVVLRHGTIALDVIGQIGIDPGSEWGTGLTSTADNTLRRKGAIEAGDPSGAEAFDPAAEWDGFAVDTFDGLGFHGDQGDGAPSVAATNPANGAGNVGDDANVDITFSEAVAVAEGWYAIACSLSGEHTATSTGGPTAFTLDPDAGFIAGDSCTVTIDGASVTDADTDDPPDAMDGDHIFTFGVFSACTDPTESISEVQGTGGTTPLAGQAVIIRGVVTADFTSGGTTGIPANQGLRGFFVEAISVDRDDDAQSSEGVFIFDGGATFAGEIGDVVFVAGTAGEFGGVTQISASEIGACDQIAGELSPAVELPLPLAPGSRAAVLEPLESMRITHEELTVTEFFQLERFGEVLLSADGVLQTPTNVHVPSSPEAVQLAADNAAATITLDDGRTGQNLNRLDSDDLLPYVAAGETLRIGDQLLDHVAVLHFGFGVWRLQPVDIDSITAELAANRTRPRPESPPDVGGTLNVASFNVLNYFDGDGQGGGFPTTRGATTPSELTRQTEKLVDAITRLGADIYGLIEIENDGGDFQAARTLVNALNAELGAEVYRFVDTGVIGTDEIKQAFIYDRRTVRPTGEFAILTSDVDPRFDDTRSRPALAQTFTQLGTGQRVTVVVNHFKSKGQSGLTDPTDPDFDQGDGQGFWNATRTASAEALADWLATNPTGVQSLGTLIIGDLNAYGREDPIRALENAGFEDQLVEHSQGIPYTYTFDGQQGTLDTALVRDDLAARVTGAAVWHINADEVPAIDYQESIGVAFNQRFRTAEIADAYYDPSAFRSSDHDPVLVGLDLERKKHD